MDIKTSLIWNSHYAKMRKWMITSTLIGIVKEHISTDFISPIGFPTTISKYMNLIICSCLIASKYFKMTNDPSNNIMRKSQNCTSNRSYNIFNCLKRGLKAFRSSNHIAQKKSINANFFTIYRKNPLLVKIYPFQLSNHAQKSNQVSNIKEWMKNFEMLTFKKEDFSLLIFLLLPSPKNNHENNRKSRIPFKVAPTKALNTRVYPSDHLSNYLPPYLALTLS